MGGWTCALELGPERSVRGGSAEALCNAIRRGADLRISTEFHHNEHIDTASKNPELIREVADFRVTYLLEDRWTAGIMNLRQPINLPGGFGSRASMSFFMYNQNGQQAIARPYLDGGPTKETFGPSPIDDPGAMFKLHPADSWDAGTNAPSGNFIYDFDVYRYFVRDEWEEKLSCDAEGRVVFGTLDGLIKAFSQGCEIKVGISGLCDDLGGGMDHEVFVHVGSCYYYTERRLFIAAGHPVVRVKPAIPLWYKSRGWDFGWLMFRTDGFVARLLFDPYTLANRRSEGRYSLRWFVR